MAKKIVAIALCLVIVSLAGVVLAKDVLITKEGKKYHSADCRLIANKETQTIPEEEATSKGLSACSKCLGKEQLSKSTQETEDSVYITANGAKYHKADCRWVKNRSPKAISKTDAETKGLKPCGRCFSEDIAKK